MEDDKIRALNVEALAKKIESLKKEVEELNYQLGYKRPVVDEVAKEKLLTILGVARVCLEEEFLHPYEVLTQINKAIDLLNHLK